MARIIFVVVSLAVLGAGGAFVWGGLFPPAAQTAQVTHDMAVSAVVSK
jgi:hypothetical protein